MNTLLDELASNIALDTFFEGDTLRVIYGYLVPPSDEAFTTLHHRGLSAKISLTNSQTADKLSLLAKEAIRAGFDSVSFDSARTLSVRARSGVCHSAVDLVVLMDSSQVVTHNFESRMVPFVMQFLQGFEIGADATRVGYAQYSSSVDVEFHLGDLTDQRAVLSGVYAGAQSGLAENGGEPGSFLADALRTVRTDMLSTANGGRQGEVPQIVLVVTGSQNHDPNCVTSQSETCQDPEDEAALLKANGATVIVVGIEEIEDVADDAAKMVSLSSHAVLVDTFEGLRDRAVDTQVVDAVCEVPRPFVAGTPLSVELRTCEIATFISACPVPQYIVRAAAAGDNPEFSLYTSLSGTPSAVNSVDFAISSGDHTELVVRAEATDANVGTDILFSVVGQTAGSTTNVVLDAWFDRYAGYLGETLSPDVLRSGTLSGNEIYVPPNDGNREVYSISIDTTGAAFAVDATSGVLVVDGDIEQPGTLRIEVMHPMDSCLISYIDLEISKVLVSGYVYIDFDGSGNQNGDDYGVGGLILTLKSRRTGVIMRTETDSSGHWSLETDPGMTILSVEISDSLLTVTEGFAEYMLSVTVVNSRFPTLGLQPVTTTSTSTSSFSPNTPAPWTHQVTKSNVGATVDLVTAAPWVHAPAPPPPPSFTWPPPPSPSNAKVAVVGSGEAESVEEDIVRQDAEDNEVDTIDASLVTPEPWIHHVNHTTQANAGSSDAEDAAEDEESGEMFTTLVTPPPWIHHTTQSSAELVTPAPWIHHATDVSDDPEGRATTDDTDLNQNVDVEGTGKAGKGSDLAGGKAGKAKHAKGITDGKGKKDKGKGKGKGKKGSKASQLTGTEMRARANRWHKFNTKLPGIVALLMGTLVLAVVGSMVKERFFSNNSHDAVPREVCTPLMEATAPKTPTNEIESGVPAYFSPYQKFEAVYTGARSVLGFQLRSMFPEADEMRGGADGAGSHDYEVTEPSPQRLRQGPLRTSTPPQNGRAFTDPKINMFDHTEW